MSPPETRVCLGAVAGAFGVRGEVRLKSFCAEPQAIAGYGPLETEDGSRSFDLTITRSLQGAFAARLSGVADRDAAEALRGTRLYAPRDRLPPTGDDEFYHADLIGLAVLDAGGGALGRVRAVHDHGAGDLLEIERAGGRDSVLLPFTRATVPTVDLASGRLIADPPAGLFEE
jgi:16S rRNA processing protein RimM